jgi:uncharacterized membrane protein YkvA (DUF1232 family)
MNLLQPLRRFTALRPRSGLRKLRQARWVIQKTKQFVINIAEDEKIPARDKALLLLLIALLASPIDIIPDFIPILGALDDILVIYLALDYVFLVLPEDLIAPHFPFGRIRLRRWRNAFARWGRWIPGFLRRWVWKAAKTPEEVAMKIAITPTDGNPSR